MKVRATILCFRDGKILLVGRTPGKLTLPGGRAKSQEALEAAARRELAEETGLEATDLSFLFELQRGHTTHHVFTAQFGATSEAEPRNEIKFCEWWNAREISNPPASRATMAIIFRYVIMLKR